MSKITSADVFELMRGLTMEQAKQLARDVHSHVHAVPYLLRIEYIFRTRYPVLNQFEGSNVVIALHECDVGSNDEGELYTYIGYIRLHCDNVQLVQALADNHTEFEKLSDNCLAVEGYQVIRIFSDVHQINDSSENLKLHFSLISDHDAETLLFSELHRQFHVSVFD